LSTDGREAGREALDRARAEARPHGERYERRSAAANDASAALHRHVLAARREGLIFMPIVELEKRSDALDTWSQWAAGAVIDVDDLGVAVKTLLRVTGRDANQYRALGQVALQ
jgi:hypothetical protein